ncbi:MAG: HIT domain-containing protein [Candidatus Adiutrix sp.]|jgi:histidine triad (HIT) family protein|nr:HIT domain-containing protein [Candidatus Adiutrix sp.]
MKPQEMGSPAEGCVFCQIAGGRLPSIRVFEDDDFLAFMDIAPLTEGHFLLATRAHYATLLEMPGGLLARALPLAEKLARAALAGLAVPAFNLLQNNGEAAGQAVPHWHLHVIPRRRPGELGLAPGTPADMTRLPLTAEKIRLHLK